MALNIRWLCCLVPISFFAAPAFLAAQNVSTLVSVTPCRIIDTRNPAGPFGAPGLAANKSRDINIPASACNIPSTAVAYSLNVTVIPHGPLGFLTLWPAGQPQPNASTLNSFGGSVIANAAIVPAGASGAVSVYVSGNTELIMDINGYFSSQALPVIPPPTVIPPFPTIPVTLPQSSSNSLSIAVGTGASSAGGALNTAVGNNALSGNFSGAQNTAVGNDALAANSDGNLNSAFGAGALASNSSGHDNTAAGALAMSNSASGYMNSAFGAHALENNASGFGNVALGDSSLFANTLGQNNTAIGFNALGGNTGGINNIGIGPNAGINVQTGSNNIYIANLGGTASESGAIRIGNANHNAVYLAGVLNNIFYGGSPLYMDSNGKLGVALSSRKYKEDIQDIGLVSEGLYKLRPVQFRYKKALDDGSKPLHYGLIAEEVESVFPQLVIHNNEGQIEGVQYQQLPPMLLNELQKQQKTIQRQANEIDQLRLRLEALEALAISKPAAVAMGRPGR